MNRCHRLLVKKPRSLLVFVCCICINFIAQSVVFASDLRFDKDLKPLSAPNDLQLDQHFYAFNDSSTASLKASGGSRVALVIGNSNYQDAVDLHNPVFDASEVSIALGELGFKVQLLLDATKQQIEEAVQNFTTNTEQDRTSLFYYAGHGVQVENYGNFIIPVDANIVRESDVRSKAVSVAWILDAMEEANNTYNVIILDACRNNPFNYFRSSSQGLVAMNAPRGSIIAYSTAPGDVALDGAGNNGLYTKNLLRHLRTPIAFKDQLTRVAADVQLETEVDYGKTQTPWFSSSLTENLYLAGNAKDENYVAQIAADSPRIEVKAPDSSVSLLPRGLQKTLGIDIKVQESSSVLTKWWFWVGLTAVGIAIASSSSGGDGGDGGGTGGGGGGFAF